MLFQYSKQVIAQTVSKRLPTSGRTRKRLPNDYAKVTIKCSCVALGARQLNKHGLHPCLRFPCPGPVKHEDSICTYIYIYICKHTYIYIYIYTHDLSLSLYIHIYIYIIWLHTDNIQFRSQLTDRCWTSLSSHYHYYYYYYYDYVH